MTGMYILAALTITALLYAGLLKLRSGHTQLHRLSLAIADTAARQLAQKLALKIENRGYLVFTAYYPDRPTPQRWEAVALTAATGDVFACYKGPSELTAVSILAGELGVSARPHAA